MIGWSSFHVGHSCVRMMKRGEEMTYPDIETMTLEEIEAESAKIQEHFEETGLEHDLSCSEEEVQAVHRHNSLLAAELRACSLAAGVKMDVHERDYSGVAAVVKSRVGEFETELKEKDHQMSSMKTALQNARDIANHLLESRQETTGALIRTIDRVLRKKTETV